MALYSDEKPVTLKKYGAKTGSDFVPNGMIKDLHAPSGEKFDEKFYKTFGLNLGNFGVTYRFNIKLDNPTATERSFRFNIDSDAPEVYRFTQRDEFGNVVYSDGGKYITKKYDNEPTGENPEFMSDDVVFTVPASSKSEAEIEVVILTGCNAPVYYTFFSE